MFILEPVEPRRMLTTFYVSPTGSDLAAGTSPDAPFRTIAKVNTLDLNAGDSVLFQAGKTFAASTPLAFDAADAGTPASPVTIGSYGAGRATIVAGAGSALSASNVAGFVVESLNFTGAWNAAAGTGSNNADGIVFSNALAEHSKLNFIRVNNVGVSGFKWAGLTLMSGKFKAGFNDVAITHSSFHDNGDAGINIGGWFDTASTAYAHTDVTVAWCKAFNNYGIAGKNLHSGNGIVVGDVDGGVIERCVAWNNGALCDFAGGGPIGIWAWDCNDITIQFNESYANRTGASSVDGGGFDFDGGVTNSVMQYNYSHDNDGAGYLFWQFQGARPFGNNVVRYNISQNDGRDNNYGGITLGGGAAVANNLFHNNTVFVSPQSTGTAGIALYGVGVNNRFFNNIVYTTGGVRLLDSDAAYATGSVLFQNNVWYSAGSAFAVRWGGTTYSSLPAWRAATGQEKNGASDTGTSSSPNLVLAGGGGTIGDPARLHLLTAYQVLPGSPAINAGRNLTTLGIDPGPRDYYGQAPSFSSGMDIGAFEWRNRATGTGGDDTFRIRPAGGTTEVFVNNAGDVPTFAFPDTVYPFYAVDALAGDDIVHYDGPAIATNFFGVETFHLNAGSFTFNSDFAPGTNLAIHVAAGATASFDQPRRIAQLTVAGTARLRASSLVTTRLEMIGSGRLDLDRNAVIVDHTIGDASPLDALTAAIASGRNGGDWGGAGITSSLAAVTAGLTGVGIGDAQGLLDLAPGQTALVRGVTVDDTAVIIGYTYVGDANLDGFISADDYTAIDFAVGAAGASGWSNGDFNYDGFISADDYTAIDFNIAAQGEAF